MMTTEETKDAAPAAAEIVAVAGDSLVNPTLAAEDSATDVDVATAAPMDTTTTTNAATSANATTATAAGDEAMDVDGEHDADQKKALEKQKEEEASKEKKEEVAEALNDEAVLKYLRSKGLDTAAEELIQILAAKEVTATAEKDSNAKAKEQGEKDDQEAPQTWPIIPWGVPDPGIVGRKGTDEEHSQKLVEDAKACLEAFTDLQLWVLSLPEHEGMQRTTENAFANLQTALRHQKGHGSGDENNNDREALQAVLEQFQTTRAEPAVVESPSFHTVSAAGRSALPLPPSVKAELLAVTFALLVHTYCTVLGLGMESTARMIRDAFKPVYDPIYPEEYRDLEKCDTTDMLLRLDKHNVYFKQVIETLKPVLFEVVTLGQRRREMAQQDVDEPHAKKKIAKLCEYDRNISMRISQYKEQSNKGSQMYDRTSELPFLRRARVVKWHLHLSHRSYAALAAFLNGDASSTSPCEALVHLSMVLQTKCILNVEQRDPLPITPALVLDDIRGPGLSRTKGATLVDFNQNHTVRWACPAPNNRRDSSSKTLTSGLYPKFNLDEEYDNEMKASFDKNLVEWNRAMLVNGVRRLEALERKREYDALSSAAQKRLRQEDEGGSSSRRFASVGSDPLRPSILLTTLGAASPTSSFLLPSSMMHTAAAQKPQVPTMISEETGIGLCCAKICPPDGQRIAGGCEDSSVRIWKYDGQDAGEPSQVLLGHKNGLPVFDVSWNKDGRTLLSAGGDGTIRLWNTDLVGPFGEVSTPKDSAAAKKKAAAVVDVPGEPDMRVPDTRPENSSYSSGAALAVYRCRVPNTYVWPEAFTPTTPIWSVEFSPCGYYFASAGASSAWIWVTERAFPVRLLTGHSAPNVNCVSWHPNANYVITGSDDKTARLWDMHTGRMVRLLTGCSAGVNQVRISPDGRCAAGSDYAGVTHVWDLDTGKKLSELHSQPTRSRHCEQPMVHSLCFSACGAALATGGDDCCVRIWDVQSEPSSPYRVSSMPVQTFPTKQTVLMDLYYTPRSLLLSVGKYTLPVPAVGPSHVV